MSLLRIRYIPGMEKPSFLVENEGNQAGNPITVDSPQSRRILGQDGVTLPAELRWYLEDFLGYPFSPATERAERLIETLQQWGKETFQALFGNGQAAVWLDRALQDAKGLTLQILSDDPSILGWPWEALQDPQRGPLATLCRIDRRLSGTVLPKPFPASLLKDRLNILLVTARPFEKDVHYRTLSRPLVELVEREDFPASIHVLRPPTFAALRRHLEDHPGVYHVLHFDGHGEYGQETSVGGSGSSRHVLGQGNEGILVFENDKGEKDRVRAGQLAALMGVHAIPVVVLNACRSAMIDETAQDTFSSTASALLQAGVHGVVAMAYSLYVSGAQEFLPAFYRELFLTGDPSKATLAGRRKMLEQPHRISPRGRFPLNDYLVPVVYRQTDELLSFSKTQAEPSSPSEPRQAQLPEEAMEESPYGFIGRDQEILQLERALRQDVPAILVSGLGGVGKTTLAQGFVQWLRDTQGLEGCLWVSFKGARSAEWVFTQMGLPIFGEDFRLADMKQKLAALLEVMTKHRFVVVWDNFETVAGIAGSYITPAFCKEDQALLHGFLKKLWKKQTKILITSRSEERWLGTDRLKQSIGGLSGEERWEYCEKVLTNLGLKVDRGDSELEALMKQLGGHPLAMRVVLPLLEDRRAGEVLQALRENTETLGTEASELHAALRFVETGLSQELRPLLIPLALHELYADADYLELMAKQVDEGLSRESIPTFFSALASAGVVRHLGQNIYELHPALTGFLRTTVLKNSDASLRDRWTRAFVDVMGSVANALAPKELHEQRIPFHLHGANFHHALAEARRLAMNKDVRALVQSLATWAQNNRNFAEAETLYKQLANYSRNAGNHKGEASAYHQLGMVIEEQRDFKSAESWYLKALAIEEKHGNEHGAASTYGQLGNVAHGQRNFKSAEAWYLKALAIFEKLGIEHHVASTYHQLGMVADTQRDFKAAESWYLKALTIKEELGDEHSAATTYHQLGNVAYLQGDFQAAEIRYLKALAIEEKLGIYHYAAQTYGQLGILALEQRDFKPAEAWYLKALAIFEKLGDEHSAATSYHQLGNVAYLQRDFKSAKAWYLKSLAIFEKLGDEHSVATTYHGLGTVAQQQRDFQAAEAWYLKALAIFEKLGDEHGAAQTYGQLGTLFGLQERWEESVAWLIRCLQGFLKTNDPYFVEQTLENLAITYRKATPEARKKIKKLWEEAGMTQLFSLDEIPLED